ncbi:MAG: macrocin O-methyltransferase [Pseudanabaena frigida]|uniref:Macrocin O-methyltransferase n=1 Tax=Pseudanabaena frigida TaxID=945775 RepID=A0A2W4XUH0_9CYAN|nr:MAG: macrocin O-methyltransferase [Pseudanabaena frigida]
MLKKAIKSVARTLGYDFVRYNKFPLDFESRHIEIIDRVSPYTLTSLERIYSLIESVRYVLQNNIKGDFVECGVYKGGSMMAIALALIAEDVRDRELYLFDTFEGMPAPDERDIDLLGKSAMEEFSKRKISDVSSTWVNASVEEVKQAMALTGYPMERIHFVKGLVENTIPEQAPESIAVMRLDTDWYKSTIHELEYLYPRLSPKGILIVDDYGHFKGAREATDEYFYKNKMMPFLHRIDYTGRLIVNEV